MRASALNVTTLSFIFLWTQDHPLNPVAYEGSWRLASLAPPTRIFNYFGYIALFLKRQVS